MNSANTNIQRSTLDILLTFSRQSLSGVAQLGTVVIVGRSLGSDGAGAYGVALLLPQFLSMILSLGLASSSIYYVASGQFTAQTVWCVIRDAAVFLAILGSVAGVALIYFQAETLFPGVPNGSLEIVLLIFPMSLVGSLALGMLQALQDFKSMNAAVLCQSLSALTLVLSLALIGVTTLQAFLIAITFSHCFASSIALVLLSRHVHLFAPAVGRKKFLEPAVKYGLKAYSGNLVAFLNYRLDLMLVNLLAGTAAAGIYAVSIRLAEQMWIFSEAFATVIFPRLSAMVDDEHARRSFSAFMSRAVLCITLIASAILAAIADPLVHFLFGNEFHDSVWVLYVLLPGIVVMAGVRVLAHDLAARGFVGSNLIVALAAFAANAIGNLVLIPEFGAYGAALSTTFSYLLMVSVHVWLQANLCGQKASDLLFVRFSDVKHLLLMAERRL